jgi:hypothetical protein
LKLPPAVHHHAHHRVWQRGFYDIDIGSEEKRLEKLNYMHNNPVKRGLVAQPAAWPRSSWNFYYLGDSSRLTNALTDGTRWSRYVLLSGRLILHHREGRQRGHELLYAYSVKVHHRLIAVAFEDRTPTIPEMANRLPGF